MPGLRELARNCSMRTCVIVGVIAWLTIIIARLRFEPSLDELGTFWTIDGSLLDVFRRSVGIQGQSPLFYVIEWCAANVTAHNVLPLRLISLACVALAALTISKLAMISGRASTGRLAALFFLLHPEVIRAGTDARSYAMAILFAVISSLLLLRWIELRTTRHLILYSLALAATIYAHYLFGTVLFVHLLYLLGSRKKVHAFQLRDAALAIGLVLALLLPTVSQLEILFAKRALLSFSPVPSLSDLMSAVLRDPVVVTLTLLIVFFVTLSRSKKFSDIRDIHTDLWILGALLYLIPTSSVFLYSIVSHNSIFVTRYYSLSAAGSALLCGLLISSLRSLAYRKAITILVGLVLIGVQARWLMEPRSQEGLKHAADRIKIEDPAGKCPILFVGGYVETENAELMRQPPVRSFVEFPLTFYGINRQRITFPSSLQNSAEPYTMILNEITNSRCFWLLHRDLQSRPSDGTQSPSSDSLLKSLLPNIILTRDEIALEDNGLFVLERFSVGRIANLIVH